MKTNKQTGEIKHKVVLLFMGLILCFLQSCSTEEVLLEREANIKTVTKEEAIQYLKQNLLKTNGTKAEKTTAYLNYGAITQEKITNSNQFLTVIPLLNSNKTQSSRVLLLRVNDTLKSAVFTMSPEGEVKTKEFSGRIMIIGIDGEFINGFRVKDGFLISQFIQKNPSKQSTRIANKATADNTTEPSQLDEVIIPPRKKAAIEINYIFDWYSAYDNSNSDSYLWGFVENSGSGGGSTEPVVEEEKDPCQEIKAQIDNQLIKEKIDALKGKTANKNEAGIVQKKDGTFADMQAATNSNELNMPRGTDFIGSMHTHQDPYPSGRYRPDGTSIMLRPIPIFSPKDVVQFLEFLNNTKINNAPVQAVYNTMISSSTVYQLRFTGNITDVKIDFDYEILNEKYRVAIRENKEELGFLKFIKDNININGIELYEIKDDGSTNKFFLNSDNKLTSAPCQ